jgi:nitroreductase
MELMEAIRTRRSVRAYEDSAVPEAHLKRIIEAATWAPSGFNKQPWKFIIIRERAIIEQMAAAVRLKMEEIAKWPAAKGNEKNIMAMLKGFTVFKEAPVAIAVLTCEYIAPMDKILAKENLTFEEKFRLRALPGLQSVAAAIQNMLLTATAMGYGTCWGTGCLIASEAIEKILKSGDDWRLVAIVPVGIAKVTPKPPKRKAVDAVMEIR